MGRRVRHDLSHRSRGALEHVADDSDAAQHDRHSREGADARLSGPARPPGRCPAEVGRNGFPPPAWAAMSPIVTAAIAPATRATPTRERARPADLVILIA